MIGRVSGRGSMFVGVVFAGALAGFGCSDALADDAAVSHDAPTTNSSTPTRTREQRLHSRKPPNESLKGRIHGLGPRDRNKCRTYWDTDFDHRNEKVSYFEYNSTGRRLFTRVDTDNDDSIDKVRRYYYGNNSNRSKRVEVDRGNDGTIDKFGWRFFDSQGRIVRGETDKNANGTIDRIQRFFYDSTGRLDYRLRDNDADGTFEWKLDHNYAGVGLLSVIDQDRDLDGKPEVRTKVIENARGEFVRRFTYNGVNGRPDKLLTFDYSSNCNGEP